MMISQFIIEKVILSIPIIAMVLIWFNNSLRNKELKYWVILLIANIMWIIYSVYMINTVSDERVTSGMLTIIVDNIVCIMIAISGILKLQKDRRK